MTALVRRLLVNPVVARELRLRMRSWRTVLLLSVYLLLVGLVGYAVYQRQTSALSAASGAATRAGIQVFAWLCLSVLGLASLLVPALTAGAICGERERQTLDLLLCTRLRPASIVLGKMLSSMLVVLVLVLVSIPLFSVVFILGGVELREVGIALAVCLATALLLGALATLCSTVVRSTTTATVTAYLMGALLFFGPLLGAALTAPAAAPSPGSAGGAPPGWSGYAPLGRMVPMPPPCIDQWGNPCGQAAHPPAAGGVRAVALLSPITALCGTLGTLGAIEVCAPFGYGSVTSEATPPQYGNIPMPLGAAISMQSSTLSASTEDVRTSGRFRGWHYWQAFLVLAGGALVLSLLLSVLVLRGRPVSPRWLLRARRRRGVEAPP